MNRALILIDIQNDYFSGGAAALEGSEIAAGNASVLLKHFRDKRLPVIHVKHHSVRKNATFFIPGTQGAGIHDIVSPAYGETVIIKNYPNSFRGTDLLEVLRTRGITEPVFCGMMTHMCVYSTVNAAFDLGFNCVVVWDACATRTLEFNGMRISAPEVHAVSLAAMTFAAARAFSVSEIVSGKQDLLSGSG